jgi:NADH-quinone oxidoreductase subunit E
MLDEVVAKLQIRPGETTADRAFTVETVNCLGACALGPVVVIDGKYHENMTPVRLRTLLEAVRAHDQELAANV